MRNECIDAIVLSSLSTTIYVHGPVVSSIYIVMTLMMTGIS